MTFFIDYLGQSTMLHVFMLICLERARAYYDLCANSIIFEIAFIDSLWEGGGGWTEEEGEGG
jgi:hypothetical protein